MIFSNKQASKIKALFLDHNAIRSSEQAKYEELAKFSELEIKVVTPSRWNEVGKDIIQRQNNVPLRNYELISSKTIFTGYQHRSIYVNKLLTTIKDFQPEIIFIFAEPCDFWLLQAVILQKLFCPTAKLIFHSWQNINVSRLPYKFSFIYTLIEKIAFRNCDASIVRNEEARQVLRARGFNKNILKIYWGIDAAIFTNECNDPKPHEHSCFTIGYVGRFVPEKGLQSLFYGVSKLSFDFDLLLIGSGPLKEELRSLAETLQISTKVKFIDVLSHEDLVKYYQAMHVLVLPSLTTTFWKEQFGRVLVEAMACGTPVIGSSSGAIPEVVGDAGLIFEENKPDDLASKLIMLRENKNLYDNLIMKGSKRFAKYFTSKKCARLTRDFCDLLVNANESC